MSPCYFFTLVQTPVLGTVGLDNAEAWQMSFHCYEQFGSSRVTCTVSSREELYS
jgi:hypothetical protein